MAEETNYLETYTNGHWNKWNTIFDVMTYLKSDYFNYKNEKTSGPRLDINGFTTHMSRPELNFNLSLEVFYEVSLEGTEEVSFTKTIPLYTMINKKDNTVRFINNSYDNHWRLWFNLKSISNYLNTEFHTSRAEEETRFNSVNGIEDQLNEQKNHSEKKIYVDVFYIPYDGNSLCNDYYETTTLLVLLDKDDKITEVKTIAWYEAERISQYYPRGDFNDWSDKAQGVLDKMTEEDERLAWRQIYEKYNHINAPEDLPDLNELMYNIEEKENQMEDLFEDAAYVYESTGSHEENQFEKDYDGPAPGEELPSKGSFRKDRRYTLRIYFTDGPMPLDVYDVCHFGTEGGLLRVITNGGEEEQWWPLQHVFNIRRLAKKDAEVV